MAGEETSPSQAEITKALARAWCDGTERQAQRYRDAGAKLTSDGRAWRHGNPDAPTEDQLMANAEALWVEGHLLVVAANQMDNWARKAAEEDGHPLPEQLELLDKLRNTLEHLNEAKIAAERGEAVADPDGRKHQSINELRGQALSLSVAAGFDGLHVFGVVHVAKIELQCRQVRETIIGDPPTPDE